MARYLPVLALLAFAAAPGCTDPVEAGRNAGVVQETRFLRLQLEMKQLARELERYRTVHGDWPPDLAALGRPVHDPWGNEYAFETGGERVRILSAGPDGEFDTADDIGGG